MKKLFIYVINFMATLFDKAEKLYFDGSNIEALNEEIEKLDFDSFDRSYTKSQRGPTGCPSGYHLSKDGTWCVLNGLKEEDLSFDFDEENTMMMEGSDGEYYDMEEASNIMSFDKEFFRGSKPVQVLLSTSPTNPMMPRPRSLKPYVPMVRPVRGAGSGVAGVISNIIKGVATENDLANADQFDIEVTKTIVGVGIPFDLGVILFAPMFRDTNYSSLQLPIPAGVTLTITNSGDNDVAFTYVDGADSVTLTVSSATTPYRSILAALITDRMDVMRVRLSISDNAILGQLNKPLKVSDGSMFGGQKFNPISGVASKSPDQFSATILDYNAKFSLTNSIATQVLIVNAAPDGFVATFSVWCNHVSLH